MIGRMARGKSEAMRESHEKFNGHLQDFELCGGHLKLCGLCEVFARNKDCFEGSVHCEEWRKLQKSDSELVRRTFEQELVKNLRETRLEKKFFRELNSLCEEHIEGCVESGTDHDLTEETRKVRSRQRILNRHIEDLETVIARLK